MSDVIRSINWCEADLETVFEKQGIPITKENIDKFKESRGPRTLEEQSVESGWNILDCIVSDMKSDGVFN